MLKKELRLNLGCKRWRLDGFINIDRDPNCEPDVIMDVMKLDYPDESVVTIYAGQLIEHFDCLETPNLLVEWIRVLKKVGEMIM